MYIISLPLCEQAETILLVETILSPAVDLAIGAVV